MSLDEPEPFVDLAGDGGEQVGRIKIAEIVGLFDSFSCRLCKSGQGRGESIHVLQAVHRRRGILGQRATTGDRSRRLSSHAHA